MTKWEYSSIEADSRSLLAGEFFVEQANEHGADGWELVAVVPNAAHGTLVGLLKRKVVDEPKPKKAKPASKPKPRDVACPHCGAQPGDRCKTAGGSFADSSHEARRKAARG